MEEVEMIKSTSVWSPQMISPSLSWVELVMVIEEGSSNSIISVVRESIVKDMILETDDHQPIICKSLSPTFYVDDCSQSSFFYSKFHLIWSKLRRNAVPHTGSRLQIFVLNA